MNVKNITGQPQFSAGEFLGYVLWKKSDGIHLSWTSKGKKPFTFQGKINTPSKIKLVKTINMESADVINESESNAIEWNVETQGQIKGFVFLTPENFTLELIINKKKVKAKNISIGAQMVNPEKNPFTIVQQTKTMDMEKAQKFFEMEQQEKSRRMAKAKADAEKEAEKEMKKAEEDARKKAEAEAKKKAEEKTGEETKDIIKPEQIFEPEPAFEPEPQPAFEPEPVIEPEPEPSFETEPQPMIEHEPEPVIEPEPRPEIQPRSAYIPEVAYAPDSPHAPEPLYPQKADNDIETEIKSEKREHSNEEKKSTDSWKEDPWS